MALRIVLSFPVIALVGVAAGAAHAASEKAPKATK